MVASIFLYLGSLAKAFFVSLKVADICKSDGTQQEKNIAVEKEIEKFRAACAKAAASTENEWDDTIFEGLADWVDDIAEAVVRKWGKKETP